MICIFAFGFEAFYGCSLGDWDYSDVDNAADFQIYLGNSEYRGDGIISLKVLDWGGYEYIDIGIVSYGRGTLDFYKTIHSDYFEPLFDYSVHVSPSNAKGIESSSFYVVSRDTIYELQHRNKKKTEYVYYLYVPQQVIVNGTEIEYGYSYEFDIEAKQGWNAIYYKETKTKERYSTDSSMVDLNEMRWIMEPVGLVNRNDDSQYGIYCVDNYDYSCALISELHEYGESCSSWAIDGEVLDYCPAGWESS
ncbi:MAG: hypothetical protein LBH25_07590 [Fibromonadaceae bacterium]|nr:hypothetical protein [Fibromonadaceae bacterium]